MIATTDWCLRSEGGLCCNPISRKKNMTRTRIALLSGALLAPVLLASCSSSTGNGTTPKASTQPSVLELLAKDPAASLAKVVAVTTAAHTYKATLDGMAKGMKETGTFSIDFGATRRADISMTSEGEATDVRVIGTTGYLGVPKADRATFGGKPWLKVNFGEGAGTPLGSAISELDQSMLRADPTYEIKALPSSGGFTVVGREVVGGVAAVHYHGTISATAYLAELPTSVRALAKKQLADDHTTKIVMDLWVDGKYHPLKQRTVDGNSDETVTFSDFGKPIEVNPPPASETTDFAAILGQLGK
jgi:hypothetical protein